MQKQNVSKGVDPIEMLTRELPIWLTIREGGSIPFWPHLHLLAQIKLRLVMIPALCWQEMARI